MPRIHCVAPLAHLRLHAYKGIREATKRNIQQLRYINTNIMHILFVCMFGEHA